jgi:hypothetical protein
VIPNQPRPHLEKEKKTGNFTGGNGDKGLQRGKDL